MKMKTSSLQLPSLAGTLSIKSMLKSAPKHVIFILKIFWGAAQPPPQSPPQREGDTSSRTHPPRRLWRLDLRAFGAPHSEVWLRACIKH